MLQTMYASIHEEMGPDVSIQLDRRRADRQSDLAELCDRCDMGFSGP